MLRWAANQSELTGAGLVAVKSFGPDLPGRRGPRASGPQGDREGSRASTRAGHGRTVPPLVLSSDAPGHLLVHEAAHADVLVVGSHGHGHAGLGGVLLGSVTEYCVRHAKCPVAVIRKAEQG